MVRTFPMLVKASVKANSVQTDQRYREWTVWNLFFPGVEDAQQASQWKSTLEGERLKGRLSNVCQEGVKGIRKVIGGNEFFSGVIDQLAEELYIHTPAANLFDAYSDDFPSEFLKNLAGDFPRRENAVSVSRREQEWLYGQIEKNYDSGAREEFLRGLICDFLVLLFSNSLFGPDSYLGDLGYTPALQNTVKSEGAAGVEACVSLPGDGMLKLVGVEFRYGENAGYSTTGHVWAFGEDEEVLLGREPNDGNPGVSRIVVGDYQDVDISRTHLRLFRDGKWWNAENLSTANPVIIMRDGSSDSNLWESVSPVFDGCSYRTALRHGDIIYFKQNVLAFRVELY